MRLSFSQSIVAGGDARTTHRILKSSLRTPFWECDASSHVIPTEILYHTLQNGFHTGGDRQAARQARYLEDFLYGDAEIPRQGML